MPGFIFRQVFHCVHFECPADAFALKEYEKSRSRSSSDPNLSLSLLSAPNPSPTVPLLGPLRNPRQDLGLGAIPQLGAEAFRALQGPPQGQGQNNGRISPRGAVGGFPIENIGVLDHETKTVGQDRRTLQGQKSPSPRSGSRSPDNVFVDPPDGYGMVTMDGGMISGSGSERSNSPDTIS